jgi:hypothetical protein
MDLKLTNKIEMLPSDLKKEVSDFVDFLIQKSKRKDNGSTAGKRKAGSAKGMIKMSEDFDAPLDDLKDYM